jgi:hypothetical protein
VLRPDDPGLRKVLQDALGDAPTGLIAHGASPVRSPTKLAPGIDAAG